MNDRYFLDTNILVYSFDRSSYQKKVISNKLISNGLKDSCSIISYQVLQEFINVATRKFRQPFTPEDCQDYIEAVLYPMWDVYSSKDLINKALDIGRRLKYSFYDSLIIASALEASCHILYSEDLQDEQTVEGLKIVNPFT